MISNSFSLFRSMTSCEPYTQCTVRQRGGPASTIGAGGPVWGTGRTRWTRVQRFQQGKAGSIRLALAELLRHATSEKWLALAVKSTPFYSSLRPFASYCNSSQGVDNITNEKYCAISRWPVSREKREGFSWPWGRLWLSEINMNSWRIKDISTGRKI